MEANKAMVDKFIQQQLGLVCQQMEHSCHMMQQVQNRLQRGDSWGFGNIGPHSSYCVGDGSLSPVGGLWQPRNSEHKIAAVEDLRCEQRSRLPELRSLLAERHADLAAATAVAAELQAQVEILLPASAEIRGRVQQEESCSVESKDLLRTVSQPQSGSADILHPCIGDNKDAPRTLSPTPPGDNDAQHSCSADGKDAPRTPSPRPPGNSDAQRVCGADAKDAPSTASPSQKGTPSTASPSTDSQHSFATESKIVPIKAPPSPTRRGSPSRCIPSATVASVGPPFLGSGAEQLKCYVGRIRDTAEEAALLEGTGCAKAFRIGRIGVTAGAASVPAEIRLVIVNSGRVQWPATVGAICVRGDSLGCPLCALSLDAPVIPGGHAELALDLTLPAAEPGTTSSLWALMDAATGFRLGPALVLDVERKMPL